MILGRFLVLSTVCLAASQASGTLTVADLVAQLGVSATGLSPEALARRTTSGNSLTQDGTQVIATYDYGAGDTLKPPLYVLLREPGRPWREAQLVHPGAPPATFGSITRLHLTASWILASGHLGPSAGEVVVIRRADLTLQTVLDGWVETVLPGEIVVLERNMVHFAPGHPGQLATFDPRTGRTSQLYPPVFAQMDSPGSQGSGHRAAFIERLKPIMKAWEATGDTNPLGFEPEWFDATYGEYVYNAASDTLQFNVTLAADRHPPALSPPLRDVYQVRCAPMRAAARACTER